MFAVGVAALDHKVLDDTMDEQRIIDAHLRDFQEIVAGLGRFVIQGDADVASRCLKQNLSVFRLRRCWKVKKREQ